MRTAITMALLIVTASPAESQTDPIRCWWRSDQGAIVTGEAFKATLTCAVREQETTRTVADETRLAAAVVQLAPFEVLGGTHPDDLRTPTHRFFQYHYSLRLIDRDAIGRDARFPDLHIAYRVQTLSNGEWVAGRDRTYTIPSTSVRVLSVVPLDASDIRDATAADFGSVSTLRARARVFEIAAYALFALGLIVGVPAIVRLVKGSRRPQPAEAARLPRRSVMLAVRSELDRIARESGGGWTPDLASRALGMLRLAATSGLDDDVASHELSRDEAIAERFVINRGIFRKRRFAISSSITPADVSRALSRGSSISATQRLALTELADAMSKFAASVYSASFTADALDDTFARAREATRQLRVQ